MSESELTFGEIAEEIAEYLAGEARINELADIFLAKMAEDSPGVQHSVKKMRRRQSAFTTAMKHYRQMALREAEFRALMSQVVSEQKPPSS